MTSLLVGIDWSSRSLDFALIPLEDDNLDPTCPRVTFRTQAIDKHLKGTERIRVVREAMMLGLRDITIWKNRSFNPAPWTQAPAPHHEVSSVWVEEAWGIHRGTDRILLPIFGAIVAAVPSRMSVAALSAKEWRYELEIKNSQGELRKAASIEYANSYLESYDLETITSEHQAEALCVALAGRSIIMKHWARGEIL